MQRLVQEGNKQRKKGYDLWISRLKKAARKAAQNQDELMFEKEFSETMRSALQSSLEKLKDVAESKKSQHQQILADAEAAARKRSVQMHQKHWDMAKEVCNKIMDLVECLIDVRCV